MIQPLVCTLPLEIDPAVNCTRYMVHIGLCPHLPLAEVEEYHELWVVSCRMEVRSWRVTVPSASKN